MGIYPLSILTKDKYKNQTSFSFCFSSGCGGKSAAHAQLSFLWVNTQEVESLTLIATADTWTICKGECNLIIY